jgi:hypothetical protein
MMPGSSFAELMAGEHSISQPVPERAGVEVKKSRGVFESS